MKKIVNICVFCGSSTGDNPIYAQAARNLGELMAVRGFNLVYGAGNIGLMGVLADTVLKIGRKAIGVIPEKLVGEN